MGIALAELMRLQRSGLLPSGCRVLDIGSSNLYKATPELLRQFFASYDRAPDEVTLGRLAEGSAFGPSGGRNDTFLGEVLELAGLDYVSLDIANGHKTVIFDLNTERLPKEFVGAFDLVINYGTTEHVLNQLNAMCVIHDAAKVGGHIVHSVPGLGFIDHGYVCYTPRMFFDLAGHNEYKVISFDYIGPLPGKPIMNIVNDYASYFPALLESKPSDITATDVGLRVILKKVISSPFRTPVERSTSVSVS